MRRFAFLLAVTLAGCSTPSVLERPRAYQDSLTYTFERKSPPSEGDPMLQIFSSVRSSAKQVKEWEKKHLW